MIDVTTTERGGPRAILKSMDEAAQRAAESVVELWHREYMPRHFEPEAEQLYGYMPRKGETEAAMVYEQNPKSLLRALRVVRNRSYWWWKKRKFPGAPDLVKTGETREMVESLMRIKSKVIRKSASVEAVDVLNVPKYFYQYRRRTDGTFVDKVAELTRSIPAEETALGKFLAASMTANIRQLSERVPITE